MSVQTWEIMTTFHDIPYVLNSYKHKFITFNCSKDTGSNLAHDSDLRQKHVDI